MYIYMCVYIYRGRWGIGTRKGDTLKAAVAVVVVVVY